MREVPRNPVVFRLVPHETRRSGVGCVATAEYSVEYGRCLLQLGELKNGGDAILRGVEQGFCDRQRIEDDTLYDPLRHEPVYRQIIDTLTARCIPK